MARIVRVAAVGDVHCGKGSQGQFQPMFARVAESADVLVLCGDLTDYGLPEEARVLVRELSAAVKVPTVAVYGNHDLESGHAQIQCNPHQNSNSTLHRVRKGNLQIHLE